MKRLPILFIIAALVCIEFSLPLNAREKRVDQLPNGGVDRCANCHVSAGGGGPRNPFGEAVLNGFLNGGQFGDVNWVVGLAHLDSDNDGFMNGEELQDLNAEWMMGDPAPGNPALVSNPGEIGSIPNGDGALFTLNFTDMTPHIGQLLELRLVDVETGMEVNSTFRPAVPAATFKVALYGLQETRAYFADFYADLNGNGQYDPPPVDHAWRIEIPAVEGPVEENFTHNTNFTDIRWGQIVGVDSFNESEGPVLHANYPNPVYGATNIAFELQSAADVRIEIFDARGQIVSVVMDGYLDAGHHSRIWDLRAASDAARVKPGIYFYRLKAGAREVVRTMIVVE